MVGYTLASCGDEILLGIGMAERQLRRRGGFHAGLRADVEPCAGISGRHQLAVKLVNHSGRISRKASRAPGVIRQRENARHKTMPQAIGFPFHRLAFIRAGCGGGGTS